MQTNLEVESKLELNQFDFEHLLACGHIKKATEQLNIYYDSNWALASASATFRIRRSLGRPPVATLKIPICNLNGQRMSREIETHAREAIALHIQALSTPRQLDVRSHLSSTFRDALLGLNISRLQRVGHMRNRRHVVVFDGMGEIELDWVRLPNGQDFFEAEIETDNPHAHQHLVSFVRHHAPSSRPSEISKFERFQQTLQDVASASRSSIFAS